MAKSGSNHQSMTVGGSVTNGIQNIGGGNTIKIGSDDVGQALRQIQQLLEAQPQPKAAVDEAIKEVGTADPSKVKVGLQLKEALDLAKTGAGWFELYNKLEPYVQTAVRWLGTEWTMLLRR